VIKEIDEVKKIEMLVAKGEQKEQLVGSEILLEEWVVNLISFVHKDLKIKSEGLNTVSSDFADFDSTEETLIFYSTNERKSYTYIDLPNEQTRRRSLTYDPKLLESINTAFYLLEAILKDKFGRKTKELYGDGASFLFPRENMILTKETIAARKAFAQQSDGE
jgi:hypothetical protein